MVQFRSLLKKIKTKLQLCGRQIKAYGFGNDTYRITKPTPLKGFKGGLEKSHH